jgi:signal transduction histidine kinase
MQKSPYDLIVFFIVVSLLLAGLVAFIIIMLYKYRKKQIGYETKLRQLKLDYEKMTLSSQLEIQEESFNRVAREIHDNINLSLTLAKLNLNTLEREGSDLDSNQINNSISLITKSITELSNISKSLNSDIILQQGLIRAVEEEIQKIREIKLFALNYNIVGTPIYLEGQKELIIFRIIQEGFNNVIKHSKASEVNLNIIYKDNLKIELCDNGRGFSPTSTPSNGEAGIINMKGRVQLLNGQFEIRSCEGIGTSIIISIPLN